MKSSTDRGFTMIELMITLTMAAVIVGLAAPNVSEYIKNRRLTAGANELLGALYTARSEAIKRQMPTTMCFTKDPAASLPVCDGDGTKGWFTWVDTNSNQTVEVGEDVIVRHEALDEAVLLVTQPDADARAVSYASSGFTRTGVTNPLSGVVMCDDRRNKAIAGDTSAARGVVVDVTGRPSVTKSYTTIRDNPSLLNGSTGKAC